MNNMKNLVTITLNNKDLARHVKNNWERSLKFDDVEIVEEKDLVNHCMVYVVAGEPVKA